MMYKFYVLQKITYYTNLLLRYYVLQITQITTTSNLLLTTYYRSQTDFLLHNTCRLRHSACELHESELGVRATQCDAAQQLQCQCRLGCTLHLLEGCGT